MIILSIDVDSCSIRIIIIIVCIIIVCFNHYHIVILSITLLLRICIIAIKYHGILTICQNYVVSSTVCFPTLHTFSDHGHLFGYAEDDHCCSVYLIFAAKNHRGLQWLSLLDPRKTKWKGMMNRKLCAYLYI